MIELEALVRTGLDDLADEVRPVDLTARVAATRRRRRNRFRLVSLGAVAAVAASAVGAVTLWPDAAEEKKPDVATRTDSWLPGEVDLATATPVQADASLRLIFQVDEGGTLRSYGLVAGSDDIVLLPELPEFGPLWHTRLSADGSRALVHLHESEHGVDPLDNEYTVVDTRTGATMPVPWQDDYRSAGLSPDGRSVAVLTLAAMDPESDPPLTAPWGLTFVDLESGATREVVLPAFLDLEGVSSEQNAGTPIWSPDGTSVVLNMSSHGQFGRTVVVSVDGTDAWTPRNPATGAAPWSPDGARLLVSGDAQNAYRVIAADASTAVAGDLLASGPTYGRELLGWAADDRLVFFDRDLGALVETDLRGLTVGRPVSVTTTGEFGSVLYAPGG